MKQVNMHEAKTHLSRLVDAATKGEPFVIARAGKPLVKVVPVEPKVRRPFGGMEGEYEVPENFNEMDADIWAGYEEKSFFPPGYDEMGNKLEEAAEAEPDRPR